MDELNVVKQIANVGFPAVIAILFWWHITTVERQESLILQKMLDILEQIARKLDNVHDAK